MAIPMVGHLHCAYAICPGCDIVRRIEGIRQADGLFLPLVRSLLTCSCGAAIEASALDRVERAPEGLHIEADRTPKKAPRQ